MKAEDILELLRVKHSEDVFVSECKDGPTHGVSTHSKLDGWAMEKSWAHPRVVGYEIKVSRSDFLQDNKWPAYLPLCNEFYWLAPKGLIAVGEVSAECGLMEVLGKSRIVTRKKAPYRDIELPESLYRYILMCRCKTSEAEDEIERKNYTTRYTAGYWRGWLDEKAENRKLGYSVSKGVRDYVEKVEKENRNIKDRQLAYDEIIKFLQGIGIDHKNGHISEFYVKQRLEDFKKLIPATLKYNLKNVAEDLQRILKQADSYELSLSKPPNLSP